MAGLRICRSQNLVQYTLVSQAAITIAFRLRFDYDDSYQNYDSTRSVEVAKWSLWQCDVC